MDRGRPPRRGRQAKGGLGRALGLSAALLLGALSPSGCGRTNQDACEDFVETANRAYDRCGYQGLSMTEQETCPSWIDLGGADCTDYYDCLRENASCCTEADRQLLEQQGRTCEVGEVDFAAMEACTGCR